MAALTTVVAFLNADGGNLIIGVSDQGEVVGLDRDLRILKKKDKDGFELKLRELIKATIEPFPVGLVGVEFEEMAGKLVCCLRIARAPNVAYFKDGGDKKVWVKEGNTKRELRGPDLVEWVGRRV